MGSVRKIMKMDKGAGIFREEMNHLGIMTLAEASEKIRRLEDEVKDLKGDLKETKDIVVQLTNDVERLKGPGV